MYFYFISLWDAVFAQALGEPKQWYAAVAVLTRGHNPETVQSAAA
jgi:hypothetical protein